MQVAKAVILVTILMLLAIEPSNTLACSPPYTLDYSVVSEDGKYIFVSFYPNASLERQDATLRAKYPTSGLYHNDGSLNLVWKYSNDNFFSVPPTKLFASSDGKYTIEVDKAVHRALAFYKGGKLLKNYDVSEFGVGTGGIGPCFYEWQKSVTSSASNGRILVETLKNEKYEFDITTGRLINEGTQRAAGLNFIPLGILIYTVLFILYGLRRSP